MSLPFVFFVCELVHYVDIHVHTFLFSYKLENNMFEYIYEAIILCCYCIINTLVFLGIGNIYHFQKFAWMLSYDKTSYTQI